MVLQSICLKEENIQVEGMWLCASGNWVPFKRQNPRKKRKLTVGLCTRLPHVLWEDRQLPLHCIEIHPASIQRVFRAFEGPGKLEQL